MSEQHSSYAGKGAPPVGSTGGEDVPVKDKASGSAQAGKQAATEVAQTAAVHAKDLAGEAQSQARNLVGEARDQLRGHAGDQHRNAVTNLRSLGDELRSMARGSEQGGVATELVTQAADRTHGVADWLDDREPEDLLDELRSFARRRPGTFLLGALAAGIAAGRLTRGGIALHSDDDSDTARQPLPLPGGSHSPTGAGYGSSGGVVGGELEGYGTDPARSTYGAGYGVGPDAGPGGTPGGRVPA